MGSDTLTFGVSGKLWKDALVMYDHQTKSLWSHVTGRAIAGPLEGAALRTYPALQTTWKAWAGAYPHSKVLRKPRLAGSSYARYEADARRLGIFGRQLTRSQLPPKDKIVGFSVQGVPLAIPLTFLEPGSLIEFSAGGLPLLLFTDSSGQGVALWIRYIENRAAHFEPLVGSPHLARADSGQIFDLISGVEEGGGSRLERIQTIQAYWFGWHNFYPETRVIKP